MHFLDKRFTEVSVGSVSPHTAAKRQTLEIARNGCSSETIPQSNNKAINVHFGRAGKGYVSATLMIINTLKNEQNTRHTIEVRIHHYARMAQQGLSIRNSLKDACMAMKKVIKVQYEYVHILRRIVAIKTLRRHLENGMVEGKQAEQILNEIVSMPMNADETREFSRVQMLNHLQHGNFFPILDINTGTISFTDSYSSVSGANDDDAG